MQWIIRKQHALILILLREDNIKMDLKESECDGVVWIKLTQAVVQC